MKHNTVPSVDELKKKYRTVRNVNIQNKEKLTPINKIALWITEHVGTMQFFLIIFVWTAFWLSWNTIGPAHLRFDPYPAFVFWLFISNMIQIFLMPLIMIGQNLQSKHSEIRAEEDFEINKKAETEIETILMHLENQNEIMLQILKHISDKEKKETT